MRTGAAVIVREDSQQITRVTGFIDFGDTCHTATICNLAIALYDVMLCHQDPIAQALPVVAAYHEHRPLTAAEVDLLYYLIAARLSIYTCMSARVRAEYPGNEHAGLKLDAVHKLMEALVATNPLGAADAFRVACNLPSHRPKTLAKREGTLAKRQQLFARSVYAHYQEPLRLIGGGLQYLYGDDGYAYLDCVNNVCQWGHCHPRIVESLSRQAARLNTNSRYVYDIMTEYAERLTATFPDPLSVCLLVNSGSEANDLALRLARVFTGNTDVIVIDTAYHGNSWLCTQVSPHRIDRAGPAGTTGFRSQGAGARYLPWNLSFRPEPRAEVRGTY